MTDYNHLNHTTWDCKFHVVIIPKYRKKILFGQLRQRLGPVLHELASRKESKIENGHIMDRPCAYFVIYTAKVLGIAGSRVYERQERHLGGTEY